MITGMDVTAIVHGINAEISRLEKARTLLTGHTARLKATKKRRTMSAESGAITCDNSAPHSPNSKTTSRHAASVRPHS
jgi:hypothetical protein